MQHRIPITCKTCKNNLVLRIAIGHEKTQEHTLLCPYCSEEIKIVLNLCPETMSIKIGELKNAILLKNETPQNAKIINISPNDPISNDMIYQYFVSPDMMAMMKILKKNETIERIKKYFPHGVAIDMTLLSGKKMIFYPNGKAFQSVGHYIKIKR